MENKAKGPPPKLVVLKRFASTTELKKPVPTRPLLWELMSEYLPTDAHTIQKKIADHIEYTLARDSYTLDKYGAFQATALSVRDRLMEQWNDTNYHFHENNPKRVYYLSIEYLLGRSLQNALLSLNLQTEYSEALKQIGIKLEEIYEEELDPGLGNGGLGRLAACYLDSLATQNYPGWGYGIRYTYGMFRQYIVNGWQAEMPDNWLKLGNPWEIPRLDVKYQIKFFGAVTTTTNEKGHLAFGWKAGDVVWAVAHDVPIPGYKTRNTINLRLWSSEPFNEFDLAQFNQGNYYQEVEKRQSAETLCSVLYPNDNNKEGKELRLKQQYFFCSATLQDIIRRYKRSNEDIRKLYEKAAIQLNDTHPTISIAEMMRLLVDVEDLSWEEATEVTQKIFAYTNHTVMPEALEKWPVSMLAKVLPRHLQIIFEINHRFLEQVRHRFPGDEDKIQRMSIVEEGHTQYIRMAHLAIVMSHKVNGVAELHSKILKEGLFPDFDEFYPGKFMNVTNGITPRRWLHDCNTSLSNLITKKLGNADWLLTMDKLEGLRKFVDEPDFQREWAEVKLNNKRKLSVWFQRNLGVQIHPEALFDIQIKRIHEYKRQLLNILRVIFLYQTIKAKIDATKSTTNIVPRVVVFSGKAAPGYHKAKLIIKLINSVAEKVNNDLSIQGMLKVLFIPNYSVSLAELIIPASDLSQHISTAGMEASGTSNMKFALNGGLIIGTLDGANIEIRDSIGHENMFIFGKTADQVEPTRHANSTKYSLHGEDPRFIQAVNAIKSGEFGPGEVFSDIVNPLTNPSHDFYLIGSDFASYLDAHEKVDKCYQNKALWAKMSILSTAGSGKFSSDRSIHEYAQKIWNVEPIRLPAIDQHK